jgi:hypothetical protein
MQDLTNDTPAFHVHGLDEKKAMRDHVDPRAFLSMRSFEISGVGELVYIIDGDPCHLEAISEFLSSLRMKVTCFPSAEAYLGHPGSALSECLILNMDLPDINGLGLQRRLTGRMPPLPQML